MAKVKTTLPMSLRTLEGEHKYQIAKSLGLTKPLGSVESIKEWKYWRLIKNTFPYDAAFDEHDILLPKRIVSERWDLTQEERDELEEILKFYVYYHYDMWFENCPKRRSVPGHYHIQVATYHKTRKAAKL